jgi:ATP-dependent Lhr-like helicase
MKREECISIAEKWFDKNDWQVFPFQKKTWHAYLDGKSGIVNAPTGSGKTYALFIPIALEYLTEQTNADVGFRAIWVTPLRALTKEIKMACERAITGLALPWRVAIRTGDTSTKERKNIIEDPPEILVTTPESIHVLFASKNHRKLFKNLKSIIVDEWHELMGSKRGVQVELALSRFRHLSPEFKTWGVSATIGNLDLAMKILMGPKNNKGVLIKSKQKKHISVESIIPPEIETYPWAGHLGIRLLEQILPIILKHKSTLIFTNTRSQCEIWYQKILSVMPDLAGLIAMHHSSINRELRDWVENALHEGKLKAVVCTSSLDLGVDFRPVEAIVQIGSPKGVSRFMQRAGRSGHQPGAVSKIYFLPTHILELVEGAALRSAIAEGIQEERIPFIRSFDVLIQYLMTLAVSDGFSPEELFEQVKNTHCFESISTDEWAWILSFLVYGGDALEAYDEYKKVVVENGNYKVTDKRIAQRHRLSIGTIVSDVAISIQYLNGKRIGTIEEYFISRLNPGDTFWFAGKNLELIRVKGLTAQVRNSKRKSGQVPSWQGGRMPLSTKLSQMLRRKIYHFGEGIVDEMELSVLTPLFEKQKKISHLPSKEDFLIEYFKSREGYHLIMFPFEGRFVHEGIAALVAKRLSRNVPISFSIAMNDYGLELLSNKPINVEQWISNELFSSDNLQLDIQASVNSVEMARRRFRDIAKISGMIFQGYPGKYKKERHLQSSSQLLFDVFKDYEPDNLLYLQTYDEVYTFQLEESRLRNALNRIQNQNIVISYIKEASPLSFPIIVDRLSRDRLSSEKLEDRIKQMALSIEKD